MLNYPSVAMVVLNWNGGEHVLRSLESLYQITYPNYCVIVVDNGSENDSVEKIKEWAEGGIPVESKFFQYNPAGKPIKYIECTRVEAEAGGGREKEISNLPSDKKLILIKNEQNYGNAKGCNIGMRYALDVLNSEYVLLLDNEMIVAPDFLDQLISIANKEPEAGMLGSKIYTGDTNEVWAEGGMINYWKGTVVERGPELSARAEGKDAVKADFVNTGCAIVSRKMCQTIGLLDEDLFWSMETVEIGIRATKGGFKVLYVPKSEVWHCQERSAERQERRRMLYYYVPKNQFILMWKHWGKLQFATATLYFFAHHLSHLFHFLVYSRDWNAFGLRLRGLLDFLKERKRYKRTKL